MSYIKALFVKSMQAWNPQNPLRNGLKRIWNLLSPPLVMIHVGKCAGGSVRTALSSVGIRFEEIHIQPFRIARGRRYLILLREPVSRMISAFNYRRKLLVEQEIEWDRFPGELEVLQRYSTLDELAECLFDDQGNKNEDAFADLNKLHHCKENIAYYFQEITLMDLTPMVKGVLFQENLQSDFVRVFRVPVDMGHEKKIGHSMPTTLSALGERNLIRALSADYEIIDGLVAAKLISSDFWNSIDRRLKILEE